MNYRYWKPMWRWLRSLSYWYFLIAVVVFGLIFIVADRSNNLTALKLRDQLLASDQAGTNVEDSLYKLRSYTYSHMNTNLASSKQGVYPPIQLKGTYDRLVAKAQQQADTTNAQVAVTAQQVCGSGGNYLICVQNYEASHRITPQLIPDSLYKFDFISPRWSPDLAGWSLLLSVLMLGCFIVRASLELWLRYNLKEQVS